MKKISLTLKITIAFMLVSMTTLTFLYFIFYNLFHDKMLLAEKEKAVLISKTIEPMVGMNYYLGLNDEITILAEQTIKNDNVKSIRIVLEGKEFFFLPYNEDDKHIHVEYPIINPITKKNIGIIDIVYRLDNFYNSFNDVKSKIIKYLAILGLIFIVFSLVTRHLLNPLSQIAKKVKNYKLGSLIEFESIRTEPETNAIIDAFKKMLANLREYTVLLERYKYAVDESSIVSKADLTGRITYVNDEFCKISGYSRDELIGEPHNMIRHEDMDKNIFENMWKTLKAKKVWKGVVKNKNKNGLPYYVKATIVPIFDENGNTFEYISLRDDITEIVRQQEQIARQTTDTLTGLPNRVKLEEDIKGFDTPKFALIDLDNFRMINDYYGYDIGNFTLKEMANLLEVCMKEQGIKIYKLSSGEFGVLVGDDKDITVFYDICTRILKKIDEYIVHVDDGSFNIHASAGLTYSKTNTIANASLALHHAKDTNKDLLIYEETNNLIETYENNLAWTKKLKKAIKDDRIVVYVQAIVDARSLETNKYECLVRMIGEDGKVISPFFFLDIAKKSKLYHTLTQRVISSSFEVFSKLPDKSFSINLSVEDLINNETMNFIRYKIKEFDIASRLVLEIVESEGIDNFDEVIPLISEFKELGCTISIDDFGTGYSNFAYLMQLNVDYIKIDGSLIKSIDHDPNSQIISKTILNFAKELELKTVAEFVHSQSVMEYVQGMGIDYLQGYHLGEPVPIETLVSEKS